MALVAGGDELSHACARRLADDGAGLVVAVGDDDESALVETELATHGVAAYARDADLRHAKPVENLLGEVLRLFGRLDIVVGGNGPSHAGGTLETSEEAFDRAFAERARSSFLVCQRAARVMVARNTAGSMVLLSSTGAARPGTAAPRLADAGAAGALEATARALALDLAPRGIRVNVVQAGLIEPASAWDEAPLPRYAATVPTGDRAQRLLSHIALGRLGRAAEVAAVVAFLASDRASFVTGATLVVDGGLSMWE